MKKITTPILLSLLIATIARADTSLTINGGSPYGCLQNAYLDPSPPEITSSFTLSGVSGTGTFQSRVPGYAPNFGYGPNFNIFVYSIDLSTLPSATNHCVKLLIHFGEPNGCGTDEVWGSPSQIQSATRAPFGDITFVFNGGCLSPSQPSVAFSMFEGTAYKTNVVTIIDDYFDPVRGLTNETRINVPAIVPDIPPDPPPWLYVSPAKIPYAWFQGLFNSNNPAPPFTNGFVSGAYDFTLQLLSAPTNGLAASQVITQTVQVANGLFNMPLPFDPIGFCDGSVRFLSIGVRPSNLPAVQFTPIGPPLPITPAPQAFYAYTAGAVADLSPGQAVTSLNGLTDAVTLLAGNGIIIYTNGNTLIITAQPGVVSDQSLKTDFTAVKPEDILARLAALPIQGWRYTNEPPGVRHVGPMAQDFKAAFGLGHDKKFIEFVDEEGVALAAIQGLNQKLEATQAELKRRDAENAELKQRVDKLEQLINTKKGDNQ